MLRENDENFKEGNRLIYLKECRDSFHTNFHVFKNIFTAGQTYKITKVLKNQTEFQTTVLYVSNDKGSSSYFHIGSNLANCFETIQDHRKRKLEKLNDVH